jgi:SAM-dependent methyltransferase
VTPGEPATRPGSHFDLGAEEYDAVRPGYPATLLDRAFDRGDLVAGSRALEVGCGTGKLTESLVARGLHVDAVDPGPNMIAIAQRRVGESRLVSFHLGRFEDVDLHRRSFDAVFSGTAFHWVDPSVGWAKAAECLAPGGLLALLSYVIRRDEGSRAQQDEFLAVLRKNAPDVAALSSPPAEFDVLLAGAAERRGNASDVWDWMMQGGLGRPSLAVPEAARLFEDVEVAAEPYDVDETADQFLRQLRTTSLYHRIDPARREAFDADHRRIIERNGGTIRSALAVVLMTARRAPSNDGSAGPVRPAARN